MKKLTITLFSALFILLGSGYAMVQYYTNKDVEPTEIGVEDHFFEFDRLVANHSPQTSEREESNVTDSIQADNKSAQINHSGKNLDSTDPAIKRDHQHDNVEEKQYNIEDKQISTYEANPITYDNIRSKYEPLFLQLQETALSRLDTLTENAWSAYKDTKAGRSERSLLDISSLYMSAGNKLQANVDNTFYSLLEQMKEELESNGLSISLVNETEMQYQQAIRHKRSEIMSKVSEIMG